MTPKPPGSLDETFGDHGSVHGTFAGLLSDPRDLLVQPDGKILIAGCAQDRLGDYVDTVTSFAIARYLTDGSPDSDFGEAISKNGPRGQTLSLLSPRASCATELSLLRDGGIVATGHADRAGTFSDLALAVFTRQGRLDAAFGGPPYGPLPGSVTPDVDGYGNGAVSLGLQHDGKPVVMSRRVGAQVGPGFAAFRFDATGQLDPSFHFALDGAGLGDTAKLWPATDDEGVVVQTDGSIVIAGMIANDLGLVRLGPDGEMDHAFGGGARDGLVVTSLAARSWPTATALASDDSVVLVGGIDDGGDGRGVLVRYLKTGEPDVTFGQAGIVLAPEPVGTWSDVAVADDGTIVAVSSDSIVRFLPDGSLDLTFGDHGIVKPQLPATEVALAPDGKIVVAGMVNDAAGWSYALARFLP